jgi:hypothetical protein
VPQSGAEAVELGNCLCEKTIPAIAPLGPPAGGEKPRLLISAGMIAETPAHADNTERDLTTSERRRAAAFVMLDPAQPHRRPARPRLGRRRRQ